ncbi:hypothetical protein [Sphingomonas sp. ID0503]|uniref:hypothetical protein n=1 Tax=Sphingomonas sp. ID0503 TaxID=3399691 RepID=UPI003AFAC17F
MLSKLTEQRNHLGGERHDVLAAHLHAVGGDAPDGLCSIEALDLAPARMPGLVRAGPGEEREEE